jgi:hypothetical protein
MNTTNGKTFKCCGQSFIFYPAVDKQIVPPDDKRVNLIHSCDRLIAWRINLTMYYVKNQETQMPVPQTS